MHPMNNRRCNEEDARCQRQKQGHKVKVPLERRDHGKTLVERDYEKEREQHLHAWERHTELAQQFGQVAVVTLKLGLVS
jgi:hypothetical protein